MSNFDRISTNAKDFAASLMEIAIYTEASIDKVIRKACIDLYTSIIERTAIDTGRAKMNWHIDVEHGDELVDHPDGFSANEIAERINQNIADFSVSILGDQVTIYNNLKYIEYLENGSSQQAPNGMVVLSLAEFEQHFNNAIRQFKGLSPA